ncbi:MAG: CBS domain-containing protein [Deltaproteobacteria bacterium]|nr:MAG: CBS domain-containing protein [Deltaproteobacteria bacterium]
MGEQQVKQRLDTTELRQFSRRLLDDLFALRTMLDRGMIERGVRRIGAEQEMFLVDPYGNPAMAAPEMLERLPPQFTNELARFNLELNLEPQVFGGTCLSNIENEIVEHLGTARRVAAELGVDVLLAGILPTIAKKHLGLDAMTPMPRYFQLNDTLKRMRGGAFSLSIKGHDELRFDHDNILFEACNTSFQVHFQVSPEEFPRLYNLAQAVTAPVMAVSVNSPLLMQQRLWRETRVALFQQSIDNRTTHQSARGLRPRVSFGSSWVRNSILELFQEDIARYRILLSTEADEDPMDLIAQGLPPKLSALRLHNGTVYRWNRPCYGVTDGVPHLRIEHRTLPSGPTPADEVANAAFFFGLMTGLGEQHDDITQHMSFDDAQHNFLNAARFGLRANFAWADGRDWKAADLIRDVLIPQARDGLASKGIAADDINRYMEIIESRVRTGQTGAQWMLGSLEAMGDSGTRDERHRALVLASLERQHKNQPVHTWRLAALNETHDWRDSYRFVSQYMATDLFTLRPEDLVDLAASVMHWEHVRHVPVEDEDGVLVGLVTMRDLLEILAAGVKPDQGPISIEQIMIRDPVTVSPDCLSVDALRLMRDHRVTCLPVVDESGLLVGMVTNTDLLKVATAWMEEQLASLA